MNKPTLSPGLLRLLDVLLVAVLALLLYFY